MNLQFEKYSGNPLLHNSDAAWVSKDMEHPQVIKVGSTYHMYFHAIATDSAWYKVGHASAPAITGPWTADANYCLNIGTASWENGYVATPFVMQVGSTFYMWYSAVNLNDGLPAKVGLATSSSPNGPWTRDVNNPMTDIAMASGSAWVGSVVLVGGTYYIMVGSEISQKIYTAAAPTGGWTEIGTGVTAAGGTWNAAGTMGEGALLYVDGKFHMFFGGMAADVEQGDQMGHRPFHIGYADSADAITWTEYGSNPILTHGPANYDYYRLSEITGYYEAGTYYIFYTSVGLPDAPTVTESLSMAMGTEIVNKSTYRRRR